MNIPYSKRSKFLHACEIAIRRHQTKLGAGGELHVSLEPGGYHGNILVTIQSNAPFYFVTDWESSDHTRFPVRIKAAATALRNCGCKGQFEITHLDGSLTIRLF